MIRFQERFIADVERITARDSDADLIVVQDYANSGYVYAMDGWYVLSSFYFDFQSSHGGNARIAFNGAKPGPGPDYFSFTPRDSEIIYAALDRWSALIKRGDE